MQVLGMSGGDAPLDTSASRWETIVAGWHGFLQHPLTGHGLDTGSSIVLGTLGAHSFPIAALYQGGFLFAAGLVGCILINMAYGARALGTSSLSRRLFGVMIAALVFAATAPSYYNRYLWVPLAIGAAGAALPTASRVERQDHTPAASIR